jgi:hypothetical protein
VCGGYLVEQIQQHFVSGTEKLSPAQVKAVAVGPEAQCADLKTAMGHVEGRQHFVLSANARLANRGIQPKPETQAFAMWNEMMDVMMSTIGARFLRPDFNYKESCYAAGDAKLTQARVVDLLRNYLALPEAVRSKDKMAALEDRLNDFVNHLGTLGVEPSQELVDASGDFFGFSFRRMAKAANPLNWF